MSNLTPDDYIKYRLQRANETISEIKILIENKLWNTAVNRMYYACFYAVGALLTKNGIETSSHSGSRQKFGQLFIHTGLISKELGKHTLNYSRKDRRETTTTFLTLTKRLCSNCTRHPLIL